MNVAHLLANQLAARASAIALIDGAHGARRTTFSELDVMARRMSAKLLADGVNAGDHALFFAAPSAEARVHEHF